MKMTKKSLVHVWSMLFAGLMLSFGTLTSCKEDDEEPNTIVDVANANSNFDLLTAALVKTGLDVSLKGTGPFTVFAPTDVAFIAYLNVADEAAALSAINASSGTGLTDLANVLRYHVANGKTLSTGLSNNQVIQTLFTGNSLTVVITGSQIAIQDNNAATPNAIVTTPNVDASNGVIHGIDRVLVPTPAPNIVQIASANTEFDILEAALIKANLTTALSGAGPFTVFAPSDAAFIAYLNVADEAAAITAVNGLSGAALTNLTQVLQYHVVAARALSTDLTNNQSLTTLLTGKNLTVIINGSQINIRDISNATSDALVNVPNVIAGNGVIHGITAVLVPDQATITNIVVANSNFDILEAAVVRAGLAATLSGTGPFTVFAPTDDAFVRYIRDVLNIPTAGEAAAIATVNTLPAATLADILRYHVLASNTKAADIPTGVNTAITTIRTANAVAYVTKSGANVSVNGARVTTADVEASNGTIHIVDQVITPPAGTIVDIAEADARFTTLVAAVVKTGLVDALNGAGPLTVFAPTNAAFEALPITQFRTVASINALDPSNANDLALINTLRDVLTYHVVSARAFATNLTNNQVLTSIKAATPNTVTVLIGTTVQVDGSASDPSTVIIPNITATNGVVHVIDRVLLF